MKYYLYLIALLLNAHAFGQIKVTTGNNSPQFVIKKQPTFTAYSTAENDYFIIGKDENFQKINTFITVDKTGNITTSKDISVDMGMSNNSVDVVDLLVFGKKSYLFLQNKSKAALKNQLIAKTVDVNGNITNDAIPIASMDFVKISNGGKWYICLTPDQKHIAIVGISPHVKDVADMVNYFILDESLKIASQGQFSFAGYTKELIAEDFLASDKGDFYLTNFDYDKSYTYPVVYKYAAGGTPMIIPVMITDPALKNLSYTSTLSPEGELIIAGYTQKKANFTVGETVSNGTWLFNSSKPNEIKTFKTETPVQNIIARNIIQNGDTFYLIGEQYKKEEEKKSGTITPMQLSNPNYNFTHGDINVTAFSNDGAKKFEIPISRKMNSQNFDQELMVGVGLIDQKLVLIYNDRYDKYFEDTYRRFTHLKVPVAVLITNDGLMEAPVQFSKELDIKASTYKLLPQYTVSSNGRVIVLSANSQSVKTVTFSK